MTAHSTAAAGDVTGLHHVTAIAGDPQRNLNFYARGLGLRFVKRTVNFDDPGAYHLYYGDRTGAPGGVMTFFAWPHAHPGRQGAGQVAVTQFAVPPGALGFWRDRMPAHGAAEVAAAAPFEDRAALFRDPDGLLLALVETEDPREPWLIEGVDETVAIRGFRGVTLRLREAEGATRLLTDAFGYALADDDGAGLRRYELAGAAAGVVDVRTDAAAPAGSDGVGVVHHVAFAVADDAAQEQVRARLIAAGQRVTPQIDRDYFRAIYTRAPGGVLFEVATATPGFTVDEPEDRLGRSLRLPAQHEPARAQIEAALPPLTVPG
jgi:glyoxalase family protein